MTVRTDAGASVQPVRQPARLAALSGIAAPASFITGWVVGGLMAKDYDPLHDPISRLAHVGAPTRPVMTAGLVGFGLIAPLWARTVERVLDEPRLKVSVSTAAVGTLAVAAFPLGGAFGGVPRGNASSTGPPERVSRRRAG